MANRVKESPDRGFGRVCQFSTEIDTIRRLFYAIGHFSTLLTHRQTITVQMFMVLVSILGSLVNGEKSRIPSSMSSKHSFDQADFDATSPLRKVKLLDKLLPRTEQPVLVIQ
jgi:hypothetical protein